MSDHPYLGPPPLAFAHRGGAAVGDENTMTAFARAVGLGYRYVETDVRATADGVAVLFHDEQLARMLGGHGVTGRLSRARWADLAALREGGAAVVPRLEDVLAAWPDVRFNLDAKHDAAVAPTLQAVRRLAAADRVLLASFSDSRLARMRRETAGAVATSMGMREVAALWSASRLRLRRYRPPDGVVAAQVPLRHAGIRVVDARFVGYAHRLGLHVHVWTVDDPTTMNVLLDLGVDGIMTDHVAVLRDVYAARGLWPPTAPRKDAGGH